MKSVHSESLDQPTTRVAREGGDHGSLVLQCLRVHLADVQMRKPQETGVLHTTPHPAQDYMSILLVGSEDGERKRGVSSLPRPKAAAAENPLWAVTPDNVDNVRPGF